MPRRGELAAGAGAVPAGGAARRAGPPLCQPVQRRADQGAAGRPVFERGALPAHRRAHQPPGRQGPGHGVGLPAKKAGLHPGVPRPAVPGRVRGPHPVPQPGRHRGPERELFLLVCQLPAAAGPGRSPGPAPAQGHQAAGAVGPAHRPLVRPGGGQQKGRRRQGLCGPQGRQDDEAGQDHRGPPAKGHRGKIRPAEKRRDRRGPAGHPPAALRRPPGPVPGRGDPVRRADGLRAPHLCGPAGGAGGPGRRQRHRQIQPAQAALRPGHPPRRPGAPRPRAGRLVCPPGRRRPCGGPDRLCPGPRPGREPVQGHPAEDGFLPGPV